MGEDVAFVSTELDDGMMMGSARTLRGTKKGVLTTHRLFHLYRWKLENSIFINRKELLQEGIINRRDKSVSMEAEQQ